MTGPDPLEADPLEAALDRYARAFPKAGLPFLRGAAGPDARRVAVEALDRAVARGRPLDHWGARRGEPPPRRFLAPGAGRLTTKRRARGR